MEISPSVGDEEHQRAHRDWRRDILRRIVEKTEATGAADPLFRHIVKSSLAEAKSASEVRVAQGKYVAKVAPTVVSSPVSNPSPATLRPRGPRETNPTGAQQPTVYGKDQRAQVRAALDDLEKRISDTSRLVEKLVTAHLQVSPSLITERHELGQRVVRRAHGAVFKVCETRSETLRAVDELLELERRAPERERARISRTPEDDDIVPGGAGRLDGARLRPTRKQRITKRRPRIL